MASELWRAGDLELDVGQQRVLRAGTAVELPRLSFELLLALLRAAPNFVSNEELMALVWKGTIVSPETVTQRVKLLRDALEDDPRQPRYIEGLRGRGYRLIPAAAPVSPGFAAAGVQVESPVLPAPVAAGEPRRHSLRWWVGIGALLVMGVGAVLLLELRNARTDTGPTVADRTAAILPFAAAGEAPEGHALSVGLVDSLASQLAGVRGLQVVATQSSSHIDAQKLTPTEIGQRLGARYLVQGSVQQSGDMLRVSAQLVDAVANRMLWTQQFDRQADGFFALQDAVASGVLHALESRIAGMDPAIPVGIRSGNVEAQLAFLRGRALLGRTTVEGSVAAEREFAHAFELDPAFVPAIVGIYDARMQAASLRRTGVAEARAANASLLEKAAGLEPQSGAVMLARAMWSGATPTERARLFDEGLRKDPSNARAMTAYSELLDGELGRRDEGLQWLERALRVDPLWPRARFRLAQRNFENVGSAVEQQTLKLLELDPNYYPALQRHAKYRWQQHGELAYPISVIERAIAADPENPWAPHTAVAFYLDAADPRTADALARTSPVVEASTAALRAMYRGDWRAAGEAALAPGSFVFNRFERWGVATALRDLALRTRRFDRVMQLLSERYALPVEGRWQLSVENFREGELMAHLLVAQGRRELGLQRLDEVISWIDSNAFMGPVYNLRTKAQALALKGQKDEALSLLAESFQQDDCTFWWYTLQFDPTWDGLRGDRRFIAIAGEVRARMAAEGEKVEALRAAGGIPDRRNPSPATARLREQ